MISTIRFSMLMRSVILISIALLAVSIAAKHHSKHHSEHQSNSSKVNNHNKDLSSSVIRFTSNLYSALKEPKKNLIFSPLSIQIALNLVLLATEKGTPAEKEIVEALGYSHLSDGNLDKTHEAFKKLVRELKNVDQIRYVPQFDQTNGSKVDIWSMLLSKHKPTNQYAQSIKTYYNSSVEDVTEESKRKEILDRVNKWGREAGFDTNLLQMSDLTEFFHAKLLSAISLEANYEKPIVTVNKRARFYNHGTEEINNAEALIAEKQPGKYIELTKEDEMQYKEYNDYLKIPHANKLKHLEYLNCRVVSMDLKGELEYTIIEPLSHGAGALDKLEEQLFSPKKTHKHSVLDEIFLILEDASAHFEHLKMPLYRIDDNINLMKGLTAIGLKTMFTQEARLVGIGENSYVSAALHKAFIEVNKKGIKAGALTSIKFASSGYWSNHIKANVEHPFVFIVTYKKVPLFAGRLNSYVSMRS